MERAEQVYNYLAERDIDFTSYEHPSAPTIEIAREYWRKDGSVHCKNLFLRNHKGNRHYLVVFAGDRNLAIHDLEKRLHQGKLSFASAERMERWLGLLPGSVSPFGLVNDIENHVYLFLDRNLRDVESLSFHPNDNRATVVITADNFQHYLSSVGNDYEWTELY
jgi:Ala-tRNA(Pro) deacylase